MSNSRSGPLDKFQSTDDWRKVQVVLLENVFHLRSRKFKLWQGFLLTGTKVEGGEKVVAGDDGL
jgi:hypothetical protein